ncbi:polysaccharide deacetylase family protein [Candidatus Woesearchaeota archaeon]|nr:polysaccharide deacetylase family protein [Candidatus Woesearchaeota archaeon]
MTLVNISVDVERDLHNENYLGVTEGLKTFEKIVEKYKIKPTLFATGEIVEKYGDLFKKYQDIGWEIGFHSYDHKRFDKMNDEEKVSDIKKGLKIFKKYGLKIKGFRAPQHSVDNDTIKLLKENGFKYDSSIASKDILQLIHVIRGNKISTWLKQFFSRSKPYIINNVHEIPTSALFFPFVGYSLRVLPLFFMKFLFLILKKRKIVVFYCHSWDFIEIEKSLTYKFCKLDSFLNKLDDILYFISKRSEFVRLEGIWGDL